MIYCWLLNDELANYLQVGHLAAGCEKVFSFWAEGCCRGMNRSFGLPDTAATVALPLAWPLQTCYCVWRCVKLAGTMAPEDAGASLAGDQMRNIEFGADVAIALHALPAWW